MADTSMAGIELRIEASAKDAMPEIDKLITKLDNLGAALSKVTSLNVKGFAASADGLARGLKALNSSMTASKIEKISRAATSLNELGQALSGMPDGVGEKAQSTTDLVKAVSKFGNKSIDKAIENAPRLGTAIAQMLTQISTAPAISQQTVNTLTALSNMNLSRQASNVANATAAKAMSGSNIGTGVMSSMKNAWGLVTGAGKLAGKGFLTVSRGIVSGMGNIAKASAKAVSGLRGFVSSLRKTNSGSKSLVSSFYNLYFSIWRLKTVFGAFTSSATKAMDFIETFHYFDVSFKKVAKDAEENWSELGYDSAEAYANSFEQRALGLTAKMTGFNIDQQTGEATATGLPSLGLDPDMVMNYQAQFVQMANGLGMTSQAAMDTSEALTMLGADWSALRNIGFEESYTKMASALAGQSRAVRSLGIDITQTTLAQYAANAGIETSISKMSGAQKAELRMIAILDQSRVAWGDMAKTLNTPANQLRLISQNANTLARILGNIFLPVIQKVLPYINGLVIALQRLFTWLGKLLGIKFSDDSAGMGGLGDAFADFGDDDVAEGIGDVADAADDAGDALGTAAENAEELKRTILGFDELNVLNGADTDRSNGTGGAGGGSGGTGAGISGFNPGDSLALDNMLSSLLDEYKATWEKALGDLENQAQEIADRIVNAFKAKDWKGLGKIIADGVAWGLQKIYDFLDPDAIYPKIQKVTDAITATINSFVKNFPADLFGRTLGRMLNTYVFTMNQLYDGIDWPSIGGKIATAFLGLLDEINPYELGRLLTQKLRAGIEIFKGFLEEMSGNWDEVGTKIGQMINGALSNLNPNDIGYAIGETFNAALTVLLNTINTMDWVGLGTAVANGLLTAVNIVDPNLIGETLSTTMGDILDFLGTAVNKFLTEGGFEKVGKDIAAALNGVLGNMENWGKLGDLMHDCLIGALQILQNVRENFHWQDVANAVHDSIKKVIDNDELWDKAFSGLAAWLKEICAFIRTALPTQEEWKSIGYRIGYYLQKIDWLDVFTTLIGVIKDLVAGVWEGLGETFAGRIIQGIIIYKVASTVLGPITAQIGNQLVTTVATKVSTHVASMLGIGLNQGATTAAGRVATNGGMKLFSGTIASTLGSAAVIVGISTAFLEACRTIGQGIEILQGGNGVWSEEGNAIDGLVKSCQELHKITPQQSEDIWKMKEDMESAGASEQEIIRAVMDKLAEYGVSLETVQAALGVMTQKGYATDTMLGVLGDSTAGLKTESDIAASGIRELNSALDLSAYNDGSTWSYEDIADSVANLAGKGAITTEQWHALDSAMASQNGTITSLQEWYDALISKCEELNIPIDAIAEEFETDFPKAVATGTGAVSQSVENTKNKVGQHLSDMNIDARNKGATFAKHVSDSTSTAKKNATRDMGDAATGVKGSLESMKGSVEVNASHIEGKIASGFKSSKKSVSESTDEMQKDTGTNMGKQLRHVEDTMRDVSYNITRKWEELARNTALNLMPNLESAVKSGMGNILTAVQGTAASIVDAFTGLDTKLWYAGYGAMGSLNAGLQANPIKLPHITKGGDSTYYYGDGAWFDIPWFKVDWYAKGGLFNAPTIAGVGEAGAEAALPLTDRSAMSRIAGAIVDAGGLGSLSRDDMVEAVATGVAMAMAQNPQTVEVIVNSTLRTNDEKLAQAVTRGQARLDQRYNASFA